MKKVDKCGIPIGAYRAAGLSGHLSNDVIGMLPRLRPC
jgi:hypothetical protein